MAVDSHRVLLCGRPAMMRVSDCHMQTSGQELVVDPYALKALIAPRECLVALLVKA